MKKRKTVIKIILVIMLGIVGTISTFTNRTLANVDKININVDSITKETTEVITLVANTEDENIKITQIELPNGAIVNGSEIEYTTNENGIYEFEVFYEESTLESNVIESSKIISYEVTSMEKHDVIGEVVKQNRTLSPRTIVKNGTIGTVNWTLDDTGGLTFDGGVFPDNYDWYILGSLVRGSTKTVTFTAPITAGNSLNSIFLSYSNLTNIYGIDKLDTSNVVDMNSMFSYCESLINLDLSSFNTSNVIDMGSMFYNCQSLTSVDVSNFDTSKVMFTREMFRFCTSLPYVDVSNFDTSNVIVMSNMFNYCTSLTYVDVSNFDTSNVTGMTNMFYNCENLTNLDVSNFKTSNVTNMSFMFYNCKSLTNLDVSNFDTINVSNIYSMFSGCTGLTKLDISKFDISSVITLADIFKDIEIRELTLGSNFRFTDDYHALGAPLNNEQYTGNWQFVSNKEVFTQNRLLAYDGTKPGTYIWEVRKYDVSYDSKGGSAVPNESVEYNQKVTSPTNPTKEGYIFDGWYKEESCTNEWNFTTDVVINDVTLYAKWNLDIVVTNSAPIINAADKVLKVGDSFNPLDGASAYDNEDGQIVLTQVNVISNNVDTSKAGRYEVTYKVTDSGGLTTTKTIIVEIVDDQVVIEPTDPTIIDKTTNLSVQTGDNTAVGIFIVGMLGSISVLLSLRNKRKTSLK